MVTTVPPIDTANLPPLRTKFNGLEILVIYYEGQYYRVPVSELFRYGIDGKDVYQLAKEAGLPNTDTLTEYLQSLVGVQGKDGLRGERGLTGNDGRGLLEILKDLHPDEVKSDEDVIRFLRGLPGPDNYETAKMLFPDKVRTPNDWVRLIQGPKGEEGQQGLRGERGKEGERGPAGKDGRDGVHFIDWLANYHPEVRTFDKFRELVQGEKGEKGKQGERGPAGKDGRDGTNGANGLNGRDGLRGLQGEGILQLMQRADPSIKNEIDVIRRLTGRPGSILLTPTMSGLVVNERGELSKPASRFVQVNGATVIGLDHHEATLYNPDYNQYTAKISAKMPEGFVVNLMGPASIEMDRDVRMIGTDTTMSVAPFVKVTLTKMPNRDVYWITRSN